MYRGDFTHIMQPPRLHLGTRTNFQYFCVRVLHCHFPFPFPFHPPQSKKDQQEEAAAKHFIVDLEASISKLSIVPDSSPLTAKLVLIFWGLSL